MDAPLSLLVVDMSESWEEVLKAVERGYGIEWSYNSEVGHVRETADPQQYLTIQYPHGSVRAGFNAVIDSTRIASSHRIPTYAVEMYDSWADGDDQTCLSLQPYIPKENRYEKGSYSAFSSKKFAARMEQDNCTHLMVIGYDRDDCVLATIKAAVERGIHVVTSEQCMLTQDSRGRREASLEYFRAHTTFLETLPDVWNYLFKHRAP